MEHRYNSYFKVFVHRISCRGSAEANLTHIHEGAGSIHEPGCSVPVHSTHVAGNRAKLIEVQGLGHIFTTKKETSKHYRSSRCGIAETNPTSIHEDSGSIPGLAQWVGDPVLP